MQKVDEICGWKVCLCAHGVWIVWSDYVIYFFTIHLRYTHTAKILPVSGLWENKSYFFINAFFISISNNLKQSLEVVVFFLKVIPFCFLQVLYIFFLEEDETCQSPAPKLHFQCRYGQVSTWQFSSLLSLFPAVIHLWPQRVKRKHDSHDLCHLWPFLLEFPNSDNYIDNIFMWCRHMWCFWKWVAGDLLLLADFLKTRHLLGRTTSPDGFGARLWPVEWPRGKALYHISR